MVHPQNKTIKLTRNSFKTELNNNCFHMFCMCLIQMAAMPHVVSVASVPWQRAPVPVGRDAVIVWVQHCWTSGNTGCSDSSYSNIRDYRMSKAWLTQQYLWLKGRQSSWVGTHGSLATQPQPTTTLTSSSHSKKHRHKTHVTLTVSKEATGATIRLRSNLSRSLVRCLKDGHGVFNWLESYQRGAQVNIGISAFKFVKWII